MRADGLMDGSQRAHPADEVVAGSKGLQAGSPDPARKPCGITAAAAIRWHRSETFLLLSPVPRSPLPLPQGW